MHTAKRSVYTRILLLTWVMILGSCSQVRERVEPVIVQPVSYVRMNQLGFLPGDLKTAVVLANKPVKTTRYTIQRQPDHSEVFAGKANQMDTGYGKFPLAPRDFLLVS